MGKRKEQLDYGTSERAKQGRGVRIEPRDTSDEYGRLIKTTGAKARDTGLIDEMYEKGRLESSSDKSDEAYRRLQAGLWYRSMHERFHLSATYPAYEGGIEKDKGEWSDSFAWNYKCWLETRRDMGQHDRILFAACVENTMPDGYTEEGLRRALMALADWRGI